LKSSAFHNRSNTLFRSCYYGYVFNSSIKPQSNGVFRVPRERASRSPAQQMSRLQLSGVMSQYFECTIFCDRDNEQSVILGPVALKYKFKNRPRAVTEGRSLTENNVQCWGHLISSDHQLYRVTPLKTPFRLLIPLLQSSPARNYNHNYFLHCVTFTQLTIIHVRDYNHLLHSYTGGLLSYQLLPQIITRFTSSHSETLAEILLREFTSQDCYLTTDFLTVTPGTELNTLTASLI
jgi:hypothetical protein